MVVNWVKSIIMRLANEFDLLQNDQIKVLLRGQQTRVLGIMMGHSLDINNAYNKLHDKI